MRGVAPVERWFQIAGVEVGAAPRARAILALGMKAIGGTVMPFVGNDCYHPDAAAGAARQAVNASIRKPGHFDAIVDFDQVVHDPTRCRCSHASDLAQGGGAPMWRLHADGAFP